MKKEWESGIVTTNLLLTIANEYALLLTIANEYALLLTIANKYKLLLTIANEYALFAFVMPTRTCELVLTIVCKKLATPTVYRTT